MKKISIVIPCYNAAEYLDLCMEQIIGQTIGLENIEIILVDDASTDHGATLDLIMEYEKKFPNEIIAIPLEQNMRQGGARNVGISYASGEYLMFCDADDWLALDAMEFLYNVAKKEDADVVEYRYRKVTDRTDIPRYMEYGDGEDESYLIEMTEETRKKTLIVCLDEFSLGALRKLYRLSMIRDNHIRFAEHLIYEEPSFTIPVRLYEKIHIFEDAVCYFYFQSRGSTMRGKWDDRKWDNIKVWLALMSDLEERGFLQKYYDELSYLFCEWGFRLSVIMLLEKGYYLSTDEAQFLKNSVLRLFPDILSNPYIKNRENEKELFWNEILEMELTEERIEKLNRVLEWEKSYG